MQTTSSYQHYFIAFAATLSGADDWVEVAEIGEILEGWFVKYVPMPNRVPSHDTFGRVFWLIEPAAFNQLLVDWAGLLRQRVDKEVVLKTVQCLMLLYWTHLMGATLLGWNK